MGKLSNDPPQGAAGPLLLLRAVLCTADMKALCDWSTSVTDAEKGRCAKLCEEAREQAHNAGFVEASRIHGREIERLRERLQAVVDEPKATMSDAKAIKEMVRQARLGLDA